MADGLTAHPTSGELRLRRFFFWCEFGGFSNRAIQSLTYPS
jgi:hypothetical protein